jgi:RHS repeat-associated protein
MNGGYVALGYNDLGQLVSKTANGVTTRYLVDDLSPTGYSQVAEEAVNGAITRRYTYGLERISQDQVIESVWTPSFYQYDGRGTVRMLTNAAGAVTDAYEYDAFGNLLDHTGTTPNNYLYRGEQWDPDLSLYYLSARYYNPATGRFMSQDPYGGDIRDPASLHRYRYASGNPVNRIDPSGRDDTTEIALGVSWTAIQGYAAIYALGKSINCIYESEASAVRVLNGPQTGAAFEQLLSLRLDEGTCAASAVFSGFALGGMAYGGLQSLLADTEPVAMGAGASQGVKFAPCGLCFAAATPVQTEQGEVPIERIKVGDKVWARDTKTGKNELRTVTAVAPQHRDKLVELRVAGEEHTLRATPAHPFRARRNADDAAHWIDAGDLVADEQIETQDGRWVAVQSVTPISGLATVYNFTVADDHDYFVGEQGLLVHNAPGVPIIFPKGTFFPDPANPSGIYTYPATGNYGLDKQLLENLAGVPDSDEIDWFSHHIDYDPTTGMMRGQLVHPDYHPDPHIGGANDFKDATGGIKYGTPEAEQYVNRFWKNPCD